MWRTAWRVGSTLGWCGVVGLAVHSRVATVTRVRGEGLAPELHDRDLVLVLRFMPSQLEGLLLAYRSPMKEGKTCLGRCISEHTLAIDVRTGQPQALRPGQLYIQTDNVAVEPEEPYEEGLMLNSLVEGFVYARLWPNFQRLDRKLLQDDMEERLRTSIMDGGGPPPTPS